MASKKKVRILWGWRILSLNILLFPLADISPYILSLLLAADAILLVLMFCKYKNLHITLDENKLILKQGIILRKSICIVLNRTCAIKQISSPLSRKLNLCNLLIYCEGVRFLLPLTDKPFAADIQKHIKKAKK